MSSVLLLIAAALGGYLLGSLSGSLLIGRLRGIDIRRQGSGNAGGTNAFRTQGLRFALLVVAIDIGKGALAAFAALHLAARWQPEWALWCAVLATLGAIVGHLYPLYFGFRGGKGAATAIGGLAVLVPLLLLPLLAAWLLVLFSSGYVGLATVVAALLIGPALALLVPAGPELWLLAAATTLLVVFAHRSNLQRLMAGEEHCFERARLFRRRRSEA